MSNNTVKEALRHSAVVLGASGNVGGAIVRSLISNPSCEKVIILHRRTVDEFINSPKVEQHITDLNHPDQAVVDKAFQKADSLYVAIGVGEPSKASKETLYNVDVTIPTTFAKHAKAAGVKSCALLTTTGSDITGKYSSITGTTAGSGYYVHCKGQIEKNIEEIGFQSLSIFKPAALLGNTNTPAFVNWLSPKIHWALPARWHGIQITSLAEKMIKVTEKALENKGPKVASYEGTTLHDI
eukprot:CFRG0843T1